MANLRMGHNNRKRSARKQFHRILKIIIIQNIGHQKQHYNSYPSTSCQAKSTSSKQAAQHIPNSFQSFKQFEDSSSHVLLPFHPQSVTFQQFVHPECILHMMQGFLIIQITK